MSNDGRTEKNSLVDDDIVAKIAQYDERLRRGDFHDAGTIIQAISEVPDIAELISCMGMLHTAFRPGAQSARLPGEFFTAAAEAIRCSVVEDARRNQGLKPDGCPQMIDPVRKFLATHTDSGDLLALDEALTRLARESPGRAELVKLCFFARLTVPEAAEVLGISLATAERYWTYSRAWLYAEVNDPKDSHASK